MLESSEVRESQTGPFDESSYSVFGKDVTFLESMSMGSPSTKNFIRNSNMLSDNDCNIHYNNDSIKS
jgi:hypothetical protein